MKLTRSSSRGLSLGVGLAALFAAAPCFAGFTRVELRPSGSLTESLLDDLDGDGRIDPVVVVRRTESGAERRYLIFYTLDGTALNAGEPQLVPDDVIAYGIGDPLGKGRPQLVYFTNASVVAMDPEDGSPNWLLEDVPFFFNRSRSSDLIHWDTIGDLNGDGADDFIHADPNGYSVHLQQPDHTFRNAGRIEPELTFHTSPFDTPLYANENQRDEQLNQRRARTGEEPGGPPPEVARGMGWTKDAPPIVTSRALARLIPADANADGRTDLLAMRRDHIHVHIQTDEGFGTKPDFSQPLGPQGAKYSWDESRLPVSHGDINADGRVDFVITEIDPKELTTKIRLYLWGEGGVPEQPNQIINLSGLGDLARLTDVNGDGYPDLSFVAIDAGKMLELKKPQVEEIDSTHFVYLFDPAAGEFTRKPVFRENFTVLIQGDIDEDNSHSFSNFRGDYDGDGVRDRMVFENRGELRIHPGEVSDRDRMKFSVSSGTIEKEKIELPREFIVLDADGDGRSDIVLRFRDRLEFLISR